MLLMGVEITPMSPKRKLTTSMVHLIFAAINSTPSKGNRQLTKKYYATHLFLEQKVTEAT